MKKLLSSILALVMALCVLPAATADDIDDICCKTTLVIRSKNQ